MFQFCKKSGKRNLFADRNLDNRDFSAGRSMSAPTAYDVLGPGIRWRLPMKPARWFAMTRSDGPPNSNLSACLRKPIICCLLDANGKRAQKNHGKAALVSGCVPRQSQKSKGYFKTAHEQRGPTPVCFSRPIPLAGNNLTNRHLKSPFLPAMRTVLKLV